MNKFEQVSSTDHQMSLAGEQSQGWWILMSHVRGGAKRVPMSHFRRGWGSGPAPVQ